MTLHTDPAPPDTVVTYVQRVDRVCLLCARPATDAASRRCATCGGALILDDVYEVPVRRPLPDAAIRQPKPRPYCADCHQRPSADSRRVCNPCANARKTAAQARLCVECGLVPPGQAQRLCGACSMRRWRAKQKAQAVS